MFSESFILLANLNTKIRQSDQFSPVAIRRDDLYSITAKMLLLEMTDYV